MWKPNAMGTGQKVRKGMSEDGKMQRSKNTRWDWDRKKRSTQRTELYGETCRQEAENEKGEEKRRIWGNRCVLWPLISGCRQWFDLFAALLLPAQMVQPLKSSKTKPKWSPLTVTSKCWGSFSLFFYLFINRITEQHVIIDLVQSATYGWGSPGNYLKGFRI